MESRETQFETGIKDPQGIHHDSVRYSSLTRSVCGVHWEKHFPLFLDGLTVETASYLECYRFLNENTETIGYGSDFSRRFLLEPTTSEKSKYLSSVVDSFLFRNSTGKEVGVFLGNLTDWNSYYLRFMGLLPECQGRELFRKFVEALSQILTPYGLKRIELHVSPSSLAVVRALTALSFRVSGMVLSEMGFADSFYQVLIKRK